MMAEKKKKKKTERDKAPMSPESSASLHGKTGETTLRNLLDLVQRDDESLRETHTRLIQASLLTTLLWAICTGAVLWWSPPSSYSRAMDVERDVCSLAFLLLILANVARFLPLVYRDYHVNRSEVGLKMIENGFFVTSFTVQGISAVANGLMAYFPTPVVIDSITGARVHLVRWSEWWTLSFLLTFLSEEIDVPTPENRRLGLIHAVIQSLTVFAGFCCPFISNPTIWWSVIATAIVLYMSLFVRIYEKHQRFTTLRLALTKENSGGYQEYETNQVRLSLRSLQECAVLWTLLVVLHFFAAFAPRYLPTGHMLNTPSLPMLCETFCEVASKYLHILVVETVSTAFSARARSDRTLELLQRMMGVMWKQSSDTIGISILDESRRLCMVSPTIFHLAGVPTSEISPSSDPLALVFETPLTTTTTTRSIASTRSLATGATEERSGSQVHVVKDVHVNGGNQLPPSRCYCISLFDDKGFGMRDREQVTPIPVPQYLMPSIMSVVEVVEAAWNSPDQSTVMHNLVKSRIPGKGHGDESSPLEVAKCEAAVSRMDACTVVIVLRDISDRINRFEAEKRLAVESREREKDSQTNRFTRHEVKNGLLSAIGLCDTLKYSEKHQTPRPRGRRLKNVAGSIRGGKASFSADQCLTELEKTLHEILDTVMSEAMSRDLIHEV